MAYFSPVLKVASVAPVIVKRTRTLATALPVSVSARVLIFSVKVSPAIAVSFAVSASSRWCTVSVGVGGVVLGGVGPGGVGLGLLEPPLSPGLGLLGVVGVVGAPGRPGVLGAVGVGLAPAESSLRSDGRVPVPSGISCVPLR